MKINSLLFQDVKFEVEIEPEDLPVRGNVIESGDLQYDKSVEDEIIAELNSGNIYVWCCIKVTAKWKTWSGVTYLGGCSSKSEKELLSDNADLIEGLKNEALYDLNDTLKNVFNELQDLIDVKFDKAFGII